MDCSDDVIKAFENSKAKNCDKTDNVSPFFLELTLQMPPGSSFFLIEGPELKSEDRFRTKIGLFLRILYVCFD